MMGGNMAKFVFGHPGISLDAEEGEEIPTEMVAAWAAMRQAYALSDIADNIIGLDNAITAVSHAVGNN
jgi:hypothetical protein